MDAPHFPLDRTFDNGPCANCSHDFAAHGRCADGADLCLAGDACPCVAYVSRELYTENLAELVTRMTAGRLLGWEE